MNIGILSFFYEKDLLKLFINKISRKKKLYIVKK